MNKYFSLPILLVLFFSMSSQCLLVEPISINDGIWNVLSRVGVVADEILGVTGCRYFVHQIDLPLTINAPGNYCLVQSVTFSGTAVTINSSGVNFDMRNYSMDANFTTSSIAFLVNSGSNISIKNGSIQNTTGGAIIGGPSLLENIVISDVNIEQSLVGIGFNNGMNVESMLINDCYFSNGGGITVQGSGITVRGCELDDFYTGTGVAAIVIQGLSAAQLARHIIVEDCIITGSSGGDSGGITIQVAENALVDNCKVTGAKSSSIFFNSVSNLRCSNCSIAGAGGGIFIENRTFAIPVNAALIENCVIEQSGTGIAAQAGPVASISNLVIRDCAMLGVTDGIFLLAGVGDLNGNINNVSIERCTYLGNTDVGEAIQIVASTGSAAVSNVVVKDCILGNVSGGLVYGLIFGGSSEGALSNIVVTRCVSQGFSDGFYIDVTGKSVIFDHCTAQNCGDGFFNFVSTTSCQIINCCTEGCSVGFESPSLALANSSFGDGAGFANVPASLIKTGAVAASNATYWNNVEF